MKNLQLKNKIDAFRDNENFYETDLTEIVREVSEMNWLNLIATLEVKTIDVFAQVPKPIQLETEEAKPPAQLYPISSSPLGALLKQKKPIDKITMPFDGSDVFFGSTFAWINAISSFALFNKENRALNSILWYGILAPIHCWSIYLQGFVFSTSDNYSSEIYLYKPEKGTENAKVFLSVSGWAFSVACFEDQLIIAWRPRNGNMIIEEYTVTSKFEKTFEFLTVMERTLVSNLLRVKRRKLPES